jgi:hypothetical protein
MIKFDFSGLSWMIVVVCLILFLSLTHVHAVFALLSIFFCALALFIGVVVKVEDF